MNSKLNNRKLANNESFVLIMRFAQLLTEMFFADYCYFEVHLIHYAQVKGSIFIQITVLVINIDQFFLVQGFHCGFGSVGDIALRP